MTDEHHAGGSQTWLVAGGAMGEAIRHRDWSTTPLGAIATWPASLRTTVNLCLNSHLPMLIGWGDALILLYNDACHALLNEAKPGFLAGDRPAQLLGQSGRQIGTDFWNAIGVSLEQVWIQKQAISGQSISLPLTQDPPESRNYTVFHSPIWNDEGSIAGVHTIFTPSPPSPIALPCSPVALQASEERFRQMAETIQDVFWIADFRKSQILYVSPAYEEIWGRPRETLYRDSREWLKTIHPEDRETVLTIANHKPQDNYVEQEYRIIRPDGSLRWIRDRGFALRDANQEIYQLIGIAQDVTDHKLALDALIRSEAKFRRLVEANMFGVAVGDYSGRLLYANEALLTMIGYSREELEAGKIRWVDLTPPEYMPLDWQAGEELRQRGVCKSFEKEYIHKDGHRIPILIGSAMLDEPYDQQTEVISFYLDLTELKQTETRVKEQRLLLETILRQAADGIVVCNARGQFSFINPTARKLAGHDSDKPLEEITFHDWGEPYDADGNLVPLEHYAISRALRGEVCTAIEFRMVQADQSFYDILMSAAPLIHQGKIIGAVGTFMDISERKRMEEQMRLSEHRYRTLANAVPQLMWINDPRGRVQFFNQRWQDYTGEELELGVGLWLKIIHPDDYQLVADIRAQALLDQQAYEVECRLKRFDQTYRWHLARVVPFQDERGQLLYWFGTATDIDDMKQVAAGRRFLIEASSTLAATLDYQTTLINIAHLTVPFLADFCFFDVITTDQQLQRVAWFHRDAAKQVWFEQVQQFIPAPEQTQHPVRQAVLMGQSIYIPQVTPEWKQAIASTPEHQQFLEDLQICSWITLPLMITDRKLGALTCCFTQESGRVYTESELRLAEELAYRSALALDNARLYQQAQDANRIKDEFLAVLSHELRSPLNPILGWSKLLQTRKLDEQKTKQALETIERNAKLQTQLIEDLLDISRILRGKMVLDMTPVDLTTVIDGALATVQLAAEAKNIPIEVRIGDSPHNGSTSQSDRRHPSSPAFLVAGDSARLQQVVWNLLSNAVKFTPTGGQIAVRLEKVNGEKQGENQSDRGIENSAQIIVTDTGKGINSEFLPYVFDYFRQEDSKTTRKFGGLGLGLAIVRYVTELHGGTVRVDSPGEGKGATFTVRLPLLPEGNRDWQTEPPIPSLALDTHPLEGIRVLAVDDEPDIRQLVTFILEQVGAEVEMVTSAPEALNSLQQSIPDVLVCDIGMPQTDGYMLMQQIRSLPPERGGQIPAIALTAYAGELNQRRAIAAGFQRHLAKPLEPDVLVTTIATLLGYQP